MNYVFSKTSKGYNHINNKKLCQDFSSSYIDPFRIIVTCCDGHGGEVYIRSHVGSKMASNAIIKTLSKLSINDFRKIDESELKRIIKINILCEWNKQVESDLAKNKIKKVEIQHLNEEQFFLLKENPSRAFGTTLTGAMIYENKLVLVGIGDSEIILIKKGEVVKVFDNEDEPVANFTNSMCQDDVYNHLNVRILDWKDYDGVFLFTDGLSSPYQSYSNLNDSFIKPLVYKVVNTKSMHSISNFVDELAGKLGVGDDVSLSFVIKENINLRHYRK